MPAGLLSTWLGPDCDQAFTRGIQLVEVSSPALAQPVASRILIDAEGRLWVPAERYVAWTGHQADTPARHEEDADWLAVAPAAWHGDACRGHVRLDAPQPRQHYGSDPFPPAMQLTADRGGFLNIDLFGQTDSAGRRSLSTLTDLAVSNGGGLWRSRQISDGNGLRRLDSQLRHDFTMQHTALEVGDVLMPSTNLSPGLRFGGLSWGSDFSQQPELPTWPLPSINGMAALPSTAELYIDGQLRQRQQLASGPFALDNVSGLNGAGELQMVVRDTLGRATRVSQPFYVSPRLLRSGLDDYHVDMGWLREGFAGSQDRYGDAFASARWRRGLDDRQTLGGRLDAVPGRQSVQVDWLTGGAGFGLLQMAAAVSHDQAGGWGGRGTLGYEWISRHGSIQVQYSAADTRFYELGRPVGAIASSARLQAGWRVDARNNLGLGWSHEIRRDRGDLSLLAASWQFSLSAQRQLYLSLVHSPEGGLMSGLGLYQQISSAHHLNLQLDHRADLGNGVQLSWLWQPRNSPWSMRIGMEGGSQRDTSSNANLLYFGEHGQANLGIGQRGGSESAQASAATAIAWSGDNLFWSRRQQRGFVVVDSGEPDVAVYRNNQPAGRTDNRGQALIADTQPYETTTISLLADSVPLATQPGQLEARIKPSLGVSVLRLAARDEQRGLSWLAHLPDGSALPVASMLSAEGESADLPSGLDGQLFLPARWQGRSITATMPDGRSCHIQALPAPDLQESVTCQTSP